jgi:hypothetical protein
MPINNKVVGLEKIHYFGNWSFGSVYGKFVERGKVLTGSRVQGVF